MLKSMPRLGAKPQSRFSGLTPHMELRHLKEGVCREDMTIRTQNHHLCQEDTNRQRRRRTKWQDRLLCHMQRVSLFLGQERQ